MAEYGARVPVAEADISGLIADLAAKQPSDSDLTAIAALATTAFGRSLLTGADAASLRSTLGVGVVAEQHTDVSIVNSVAETAVVSLATPTGLAAGDLLRVTASGDLLNNSGSSVTYTPKFKIGATAVLAGASATVTTGATRRQWFFSADIFILGSASQWADAILGEMVAAAAGTWLASNPGALYQGSGAAAEDISTSKNVQLTMTLGTANALADIVCHGAAMLLMKK